LRTIKNNGYKEFLMNRPTKEGRGNMSEKSNYVKHAEFEFKACGWNLEEDSMQKLICKQVCELLELFSTHGHSGSSAPYAINMFEKLARFEPLCPLTGEDWEWNECSEGLFQNKRCSHVFKDKNGFYDVDGKVFVYPNGGAYTNGKSRTKVVFPYTPKTEYVKVDENGEELK